MAEQRDGFLFYRSFYEAIHSLPKKDRLSAYEALIEYALDGTTPNLSGAPAAVFTLAKPNIDASRRKAESGKKGGQSRSKTQANGKQNESKPEPIKDKGLGIKDKGQEIEGVTPNPSTAVADYLNRVNPSASPMSIDELKAYEKEMGADVCKRAFDIALDNKSAKWSYIKAILSKWQSLGVKCLADIETLDRKPETTTQTRPVTHKNGPGAFGTDQASRDARMAKDLAELDKFMREHGGELD